MIPNCALQMPNGLVEILMHLLGESKKVRAALKFRLKVLDANIQQSTDRLSFIVYSIFIVKRIIPGYAACRLAKHIGKGRKP